MFASTAGSRRQIFSICVTTMFTPQNVARVRGINSESCIIKDIKNICEKARQSGS